MSRILTAAICVYFAITAVNLQSQNTAVLSGTILDPAGAVVSNATVELKVLPSGPTITNLSNASGRYTFLGLSMGSYELKVTVPGFKIYVANIGIANAGQKREFDVTLEVGAASESVTVSAEYPLLTSSSQLSSRRARPVRIPAHGIRRPSAPFNTEQYDAYLENEFSNARSEPLSTFGVDVDTASYSNARRFLMEGQLPPPGAIRIEELINYFTYDYPLPEKGKPVSFTTHVVNSPWNSQHQLLHIGMRTMPIAQEELPPSNLTFLIDVSGSMFQPNKLPLVKQSVRLLVDQLRPIDRVALVVYAGNSGVVLQPTPGDQKETILRALDRLEAGGSTNGFQGIKTAYDLARSTFVKGGSNRVILATDGDFNVGVSSDDGLIRLIEQERESGVFLTVLGYGMGNYKDSKMEKLADHGNGNYAYIDTLEEARKVLVKQMGATLVTVAKDVKLQIEFNPEHVKAWRLIGYEKRVLRPEEFNDDRRDSGDLGAGHQVTAIYEIIPQGSSEELPGVDRLRYQDGVRSKETRAARKSHSPELAWVKLRYKEPQASRSELVQWPVSATEMSFQSAPADVRFATAVAEYGLLLRQSKFAGKASFDQVIRTAEDAIAGSSRPYRLEFVELVRRAQELSSPVEARARD